MNEKTFSDLTLTDKNTLISGANAFQRTLKAVFGDEEGSRLWGQVADNVLTGLKKEVLANCLTNKYGNIVTVVSARSSGSAAGTRHGYNKVKAIKAIRVATGLGLYESKKVCDNAEQGIESILKVGTSNLYDSAYNLIGSCDEAQTRINLIEALTQEGFTVF